MITWKEVVDKDTNELHLNQLKEMSKGNWSESNSDSDAVR